MEIIDSSGMTAVTFLLRNQLLLLLESNYLSNTVVEHKVNMCLPVQFEKYLTEKEFTST